MVVNHNLTAMNSSRNLGTVSKTNEKVAEKLSSGYKINRAGDDAAGLSISEKMRWQIRGLNKASNNAQDGISYIQTAEGALNEVHSILQRGRELSVQAANDTNTEDDRKALQQEIDELKKEVNRIAKDTEFNTMKIFDSANAGASSRTAADGKNIVIRSDDFMTYSAQDFSDAISAANSAGGTFTQSGIEGFANDLKTTYLPRLLSGIVGAFNDSATPTVSNMGIGLKMYYSNNNVLAYVGSNGASFELGVNLKYLTQNGNSIVMGDDLATTIAHEMTHAIMFDTVTNGMLGSAGGDTFPMWFIEGTAQATGGAMNYITDLQNMINSGRPDSDIKAWLSKLTDTSNSYNAYSAGYVGSMYLGYVAGMANGKTGVNSDTIAEGLDKILKDISDGYSLSQAISRQTNGKYTSLTDFENKFANDAIQFAKDLVNAASTTGTGSIISPNGLSGTKTSLLNISTTNNYFVLHTDTTTVDNWQAMINQGKNPYTGGGATTSSGTKRDGTTNPDAKNKWTDADSRGRGYSVAATIKLQIGAQEGQTLDVSSFKLSDKDIGIGGVDVKTQSGASSAINSFDNAIKTVSSMRSYYGAVQNRLEHTIANLDNFSENVQASESRIRDTDMSESMVEYSKNNILLQAGQSMLAQANQINQGVLQLLQ